MPRFTPPVVTTALMTVMWIGLMSTAEGQLVPGSGEKVRDVGDDFEDPTWEYTLNLPKASSNLDKQDRFPTGFSSNNRWLESAFRGTPDSVRRVETPLGGIPGSKGAMAMQTLHSGIPGQISHKFQQDDLICNVSGVINGYMPVSWNPSFTTRVYLPPFEKWEKRTGSQFGFRADCITTVTKPAKGVGGFMKRAVGMAKESENYWPGFFIQFNSKYDGQNTEDSAMILIRGGERGEDIPGPVINKPGWWTLGISFTSDGKVHYYAKPGVENLTAKDHLYSSFPYGYRCEQVNTFFYNIVNQDDGRTWSTEWIVDDPAVYIVKTAQMHQTGYFPGQVQQQSGGQQFNGQTNEAAAGGR